MTPRMSRKALARAGVVLPAGTRGGYDAARLPIQGVVAPVTTQGVAHGLDLRPAMNKTEAAYGTLLEAQKREGLIRDYWFQGLTFKLGDDCRYTPDYFVLMSDWSCECHEVKGFMRDDALVKVKVAARMYPFRFKVVKRAKKERGADFAFSITEVKP